MKTTVFTINKNNNYGTNYSEILDNIILDSVIKNNSYLFKSAKKKSDDDLIDAMFNDINTYKYKHLKADDDFISACNFLANYSKANTYAIPYKMNTLYRLSDGTPIIFMTTRFRLAQTCISMICLVILTLFLVLSQR